MSDLDDFSFRHEAYGHEILGRPGTLARSKLVAELIDPKGLYCFQDGALTQIMLRETLESFIAGHFVSTIIVGFSFIERSIAGRLHHIEETIKAKARSEELLLHGKHNGWLSESEYLELEALRGIRNPLVHFKEPLNQSRPEIRAMLEAKELDQLLEVHACGLVVAAIHVLNTTAF